jgi:hypothetical protein
MISEYFYMPATNKKVTEEDRIKFTQDRIKSVREFLQKVVFEPIFIPDMPSSEHDPFFDQFSGTKSLHADWKSIVMPTHVVINHNWWQNNVEAFCSERRVKIPDIDFFYILMQMCREHNVAATPRDGTMFLSLNKPNWLFNIPRD